MWEDVLIWKGESKGMFCQAIYVAKYQRKSSIDGRLKWFVELGGLPKFAYDINACVIEVLFIK